MKEFWDDRYKQEEMVYGTEPNAFLKEQLLKLEPGNILFPAEGEGRNAVFAAKQGWQVHAFDYSSAGRAKALQLAADQGVSIDYQLAEAQNYTLKPESLDAVALIYAHFPPALRQQVHRSITRWLKPGGHVILEAFHPNQLNHTSGGPKNPDMLYTAEMLRSDFKPLQILLLEETETLLNEGAYHSGKAFVTRLVAQK